MVTIRTAAEFGALARAARRARGWTQAQTAHEAGVSRQFVIALENGRHPNAELWRALSVLTALDVGLSGSARGEPSRETSPRHTDEFDLDTHLASFSEPPTSLVADEDR